MSHTKLTQLAVKAASKSAHEMRKSDRTRKAILDGALELLWSRPFRDLTVAELMEVTGTSRSAFYRYFDDLYALMETLLLSLEEDIFEVAAPWFSLEGNPVDTLRESLTGLVRVCYEQGPILRAVSDASTIDERLENVWSAFLNQFDDAVTANIEAQQHEGLIQPFSARPVAVSLNRMDAYLFVHAFGRHPRQNPELVLESVTRVWVSTLYQSSPLTTKQND
jgi:AcrR family transcriptional regulator